MKRERGQASILALLIVFALMLAIAAFSVPSIKLLQQVNNESNTRMNMTTLLQAEANYFSAYGSVYPASLSYLSACPPAVAGKITPTSTEACLVSPALTSGATLNGYQIAQTLVNTSAGNTGFLLTAIPEQQQGRVGFCGGSGSESATVTVIDGLLRTGFTSVTPTTLATCMEYPVVVSTTPTSAPSGGVAAYTTGLISGSTTNGGFVGGLTGLPAGTYFVTGHASGYTTGPTSSANQYYGQCGLFNGNGGGTLLDKGTFSTDILSTPYFYGVAGAELPASNAAFDVTLSGTATVAANGEMSVACDLYVVINGNSSTAGATYNYIVNAIPVSGTTTN
jgi:type II secretory pathway pseudopilin PulG